ncbi:MAG: hypothetical protein NVS9B4_25470 [Candidatus Acidiferrum sp.]
MSYYEFLNASKPRDAMGYRSKLILMAINPKTGQKNSSTLILKCY